MKRSLILKSLMILSLWIYSSAVSASSRLSTTVIETASTQDLIRMTVAMLPDGFSPRIHCDGDMVRVRMTGLSLNAEENIRSISLPDESVIQRARLVSRSGESVVLQLRLSGSRRNACNRVTSFVLGNEVIVSAALDSDTMERRQKLKEIRQTLEQEEVTTENPSSGTESLLSRLLSGPQVADSEANLPQEGEEKSNASVETASVNGIEPALEAKKSIGGKSDSISKEPLPGRMGVASVQVEMWQILSALVFLTIVTGAAWYAKRRRGIRSLDRNSIEILSSKRIGTKHQLVVARVEGSRFLLGITDQSVNTLGMLDAEGRNIPSQMEHSNATRVPEMGSVAFESEPAAPVSPAPETYRNRPGSAFQRELERTMVSTLARNGRSAMGATGDVEMSSNVAGLMALARMRANLEEAASRRPEMEA